MDTAELEKQKQLLVQRLGGAFAERAEVLDAYLFGSMATGEATAHSDVDVAVYVEPSWLNRPAFGYVAELSADLQQLLGHSRIDLVILNHAPPLLYHRVLRDGERLCSRNLAATTTREGRALSRYCDYVPQLKKIEATHRARIAAGEFGR